jgi:predicted transcriptional regulator
VFDEIDEEAEKRAIAKARADIASGKGVPHEKVREWLLKRGGKVKPPPCE